MVSLAKPIAIGTTVMIENGEGEEHEWIVIGHERKAGRYTGYLRVEYQGWLSASVLESEVSPLPVLPKGMTMHAPAYLCMYVHRAWLG